MYYIVKYKIEKITLRVCAYWDLNLYVSTIALDVCLFFNWTIKMSPFLLLHFCSIQIIRKTNVFFDQIVQVAVFKCNSSQKLILHWYKKSCFLWGGKVIVWVGSGKSTRSIVNFAWKISCNLSTMWQVFFGGWNISWQHNYIDFNRLM